MMFHYGEIALLWILDVPFVKEVCKQEGRCANWKEGVSIVKKEFHMMCHLGARCACLFLDVWWYPWCAIYVVMFTMMLKIVQGCLEVEEGQALLHYMSPWWLMCHGDLNVPLLHHDMSLWIMMCHYNVPLRWMFQKLLHGRLWFVETIHGPMGQWDKLIMVLGLVPSL